MTKKELEKRVTELEIRIIALEQDKNTPSYQPVFMPQTRCGYCGQLGYLGHITCTTTNSGIGCV